jgi:hypothetical protein
MAVKPVAAGALFPYKTTRHFFEPRLPDTVVPLARLREWAREPRVCDGASAWPRQTSTTLHQSKRLFSTSPVRRLT